MLEIKETCYRGTRILLGNDKRIIINKMIDHLIKDGYKEISIPIIQMQETFANKVGEENNNLMFNFTDRGNRNICLAPEYTAIIQKLSKTTFKQQTNVKLFYIQECFRGEKPQSGRYRQFTQLGVEILNPIESPGLFTMNEYTSSLACKLISLHTTNFICNTDVTRGLDYYKNGKGFEIVCEQLGSSKQICGGGEYEGGVGFAIGIDRLISMI